MKSLALLVLVLLCTATLAAAQTVHPIDVGASRATFSVSHALIERVTGRIPIVTAGITLAADGVTPTAVDATLDPRRIDTGDGDRDGDLQGSDWFDTRKFPTWTFASTSVAEQPDGSFTIDGKLTIHGVGVPVVLTATQTRHGATLAFHGTTHVDRHAFGMTITRTDVLVGTDITIAIDVQTR